MKILKLQIFDHTKGWNLKEGNFFSMICHSKDALIQIGLEVIHKYICCDIKMKKEHLHKLLKSNATLSNIIKQVIKSYEMILCEED